MSNQQSYFKLSLSVGQTLDLKKNCENFLTELNAAKGLDFASVWINDKFINGPSSTTKVNMVCAVSNGNTLNNTVLIDEVNFKNFGDTGFLVMSARDADFADLFNKKDLNNHSSVVFPLGETGYLQMLMTGEKSGIFGKKTEFFKKDELPDFLQVINSFANSISNCLNSSYFDQNPDSFGIRSSNIFADKKIVATMSSEIRNPINAILGFSELLSETELSKKQSEYLEVVKTSSKHLFNVLNEVLDYSKILARQFALEKISFDVNDLVRTLINANKAEAEKKALTLTYSVDKWITKPLVGDKHKLLHALQYLLDNAIKFTQSGFVNVDCKLLNAGSETYKLSFSVEDSGVGIDDKSLKKIFKSFIQEDDSITRKFGGLGLGLSISRYIIRALGGELEVDSIKGKGSTFTIILELDIDNDPRSINDQNILLLDKAKTSKIKVLLVDDQSDQRNLGSECLMDWNFTTASNGEEAVELLRKNGNFDVVLMDIRMPGMDGIEAASIIRNTLKLTMPIIAVSGEVLEGTINECTDAGMNSFISKPYKREELIKRIVSNLERYDLFNSEDDTPETEHLKGKRALVVEDNMINQMVTLRQLKNLHCEVDVIDDGNMVLKQLLKNNYDFVLMDLYMNEMGGFEATRELRKNGINIPVIAFSGDDSTETVENCFEAGMNGLILKPSSSPEMASKINTIIYNYKNPKPQGDENKLFDLSFLEGIFVSNPGKMKDSIRRFINDTPPVLEQLNVLLAENNYDQLWRKAHFIKSSALSLGIKSLEKDLKAIIEFGKKIEKMEKVTEMERQEVPQLVANVSAILNEALVQLAKEID